MDLITSQHLGIITLAVTFTFIAIWIAAAIAIIQINLPGYKKDRY